MQDAPGTALARISHLHLVPVLRSLAGSMHSRDMASLPVTHCLVHVSAYAFYRLSAG
jgi:hypothetical protein